MLFSVAMAMKLWELWHKISHSST